MVKWNTFSMGTSMLDMPRHQPAVELAITTSKSSWRCSWRNRRQMDAPFLASSRLNLVRSIPRPLDDEE